MILFRKHLLSAAFFPGTLVFIVFNTNSSGQQKQAGLPEKITIAYSTAPYAILMAVALAKNYSSYPEGFECNTTASCLKETGSL